MAMAKILKTNTAPAIRSLTTAICSLYSGDTLSASRSIAVLHNSNENIIAETSNNTKKSVLVICSNIEAITIRIKTRSCSLILLSVASAYLMPLIAKPILLINFFITEIINFYQTGSATSGVDCRTRGSHLPIALVVYDSLPTRGE